MKYFFIDLFDFFLPRFCPSCNHKLLNNEISVCQKCISSIELADQTRIDFEYDKKFAAQKVISGFTSLYVFEKDRELQEILHHFKYSRRFIIGITLGVKTAAIRRQTISDWNIDLIIPVPLHHLKKAERGYNQSHYIAKGLSKTLKIPAREKLLNRIRYTESQTLKNITDRESNVKKAFTVKNKKRVKGKNILLVDDVITTGATLSECARQLLKCGAKKIYAISIAIAD